MGTCGKKRLILASCVRFRTSHHASVRSGQPSPPPPSRRGCPEPPAARAEAHACKLRTPPRDHARQTDNPDRTPCPVPYLLPLLTWLRCNRSPNLCSKLACKLLRSCLCPCLIRTLHCPAPCLSPRPRRGGTARARCAQCAGCGWSPCRLRWRMDEQNFLCGPINTHH